MVPASPVEPRLVERRRHVHPLGILCLSYGIHNRAAIQWALGGICTTRPRDLAIVWHIPDVDVRSDCMSVQNTL